MTPEERYHCIYGFNGSCADCEESKIDGTRCDKRWIREEKIDAFNAGVAAEKEIRGEPKMPKLEYPGLRDSLDALYRVFGVEFVGDTIRDDTVNRLQHKLDRAEATIVVKEKMQRILEDEPAEMQERIAWLDTHYHDETNHAPEPIRCTVSLESDLCPTCGKNPASEPHPCPYKSEINGNEEECTCCPDCAEECARDI